MTLAQLFNFSTIEHRHLFLAYLIVALMQLGYLAWVLLGLWRTPAMPEVAEPTEPAQRQ